MYLIDTNVLSELRKLGDGKADPQVAAWAGAVDSAALCISAVTLMEIELGILRIERRDKKQGLVLRRWFCEHVIPTFSDSVLVINADIAQRCARLHVPDPRSERDAWIAATALSHGLPVVTRNVADFAGTGVAVINPWEAPRS